MIVTFTDVVVRGGNGTVSAVPSFGSAPTATVLPSEKVSVAEVRLSLRLGRSNRSTRSTSTGVLQVSRSHVPTPPPGAAHSLV